MSSTASEILNQIFDMMPDDTTVEFSRHSAGTLVGRAVWINESSVKKQFIVIGSTVDDLLVSLRNGFVDSTTKALTTGTPTQFLGVPDRSKVAVGDLYCRRERY